MIEEKRDREENATDEKDVVPTEIPEEELEQVSGGAMITNKDGWKLFAK